MKWYHPLLLIGTTLAVLAQDQNFMEMSLDDLLSLKVESASKTSMSSEDAPGIVTVVSRDEIRNQGLKTLGDLLNLVPGFTVGRSLQSGSHNTFYVRGSFSLYSENVLILKNGQRLNEPLTGGAVTFGPDYPLAQVKQVEIIRGPGSALYGANAFVALINIITDEVDQQGTRAQVAAGDPSIVQAFLSHGGKLGGGAFSFGASYMRKEFEELDNLPFSQYVSDNPPPFPIGIAFNNRFEGLVSDDKNESFVASGAWKKGGFSLSLGYERKRSANNWGSGVPLGEVVDNGTSYDLTDDALRNRDDSEVIRLGLRYAKQVNDRFDWSAQLTYADNSQQAFIGWNNFRHIVATAGEGRKAGFWTDRNSNTLNADLSLTWQPKEGHLLVAGYGFESDEVERGENTANRGPVEDGAIRRITPFLPNGDFVAAGDRDVHALFAQYSWQINPKLAFTGGLRADDYSDFGSTVNPRLALVASPFEKLSFKALYGQAFRAPTFLESSYLLAGGILPNADLDPEEIKTTELQVLFKFAKNLLFDISGFQYEISDVIRQVPTGRTLNETQSQNQGERSGKGFDLEFLYQTSAARKLFLNYSKVDPKDTALFAGQPLETTVGGVPKDALNLGFSYDYAKRWAFALNASRRWNWTPQAAIPLPDIPVPGYGNVHVNYVDELKLPDTTVVNTRIAWNDPFPGGTLFLNVDNLFDEQLYFAEQHLFAPGGIASSGRAIALGLSWHSTP